MRTPRRHVPISQLSMLALTMTLASNVAAQTVLLDDEFVPTDWTHETLFATAGAVLDPVNQIAVGGNPDAYQRGGHTLTDLFQTIYSGHTCIGCGSFDPTAAGPIFNIDVEYDRLDVSDPIGFGMETGVLVRQGGDVFIRRMDSTPHASWATVSTTGLSDADAQWQLIDAGGPASGAPDFSTGGAAIEFGYYVRHIIPPVRGVPSGITEQWGLDNFRIGICSPELCDGLDNDCDSAIDEDFTVIGLLDIGTVGELPIDSVCYEGEGVCFRAGRVMCSSDGLSAECVVPPPVAGIEGPAGDATCCNFEDDDCDGLQDAEDPDCTTNEFCDFCDNDNDGLIDEDFPNLNDACSVGVGICRKGGFYNCTTDGLGTTCSAVPLPPGVEGPPQGARCLDGLDNDCDGLIDINDPDCQEPEICDGIDNDGDTQVDEGFPNLGQLCAVGDGQCAAFGLIICTPDGSGTMCSASPGKGDPEGPVSCGCADGIDNDCDGLTDLNDPDCGGSQLAVTCALPFECGPNGSDCLSWHTVEFQTTNGAGGETVDAKLLGLDTNGVMISSISVEQGDKVRLASRINATEFAANTIEVTLDQAFFDGWGGCETGPDNGPLAAGCEPLDSDCDDDIDLADFAAMQLQFDQTIKYHELAAPTPMLRVLASDGLRRAEAYCSNVPYLDVIEPDHTVVVTDEGQNAVRVVAAVPLIDPESLTLKIDGVDVFALLGIDPATDFPGGPFGGSVDLGATSPCGAEICDLRVVMADAESPSSNTLSMYIENMCCGGHLAVLSGVKRPGSFPDVPDPKCNLDDLSDGGVAEVFEVTILSPQDGEVTPGGGSTNVTGEVCHGRELECPFATMCPPQVKLNGLYSPLGAPLITLGDGVNTADTYVYPFNKSLLDTDLVQEVVFNIGAHGTLDPGSNRLIAEANDPVGNAAFDNVFFAVGPVFESGFRGASGVDKGLNLALTPAGLQQVIQPILVDLLGPITQEMRQWLVDLDGEVFPVDVPGTNCDPDVIIDIDQGTINDVNPNQFIYDITPAAEQLDITVTAPQASAAAVLKGGCKIKVCSQLFPSLCWCFIKFTVNVSATALIDGVAVEVVLTENDLLTSANVQPTLQFDASNVDINIAGVDIEAGCLGGFVIALLGLENEIEAILLILAQYYIDNELDIGQWLNFIDLPAIQMDLLELDDVPLNAAMLELGFEKTDVQITPSGMAMAFETTFTPAVIDPEVANIPGTPLTDAPLPQPFIPLADNLAIAISDDAINQLFHASARTGALITEYEDNTHTIDDLLPVNCNTLAGEPGKQGACVGLRGGNCAALPAGLARNTCIQTAAVAAQMNIDSSTLILLHGRVDISPKLLIIDNPGTPNVVETDLRLSQLAVGIIADRDGDGLFTTPYDAVPACSPLNPATSQECALWEACLDIDFFTDLSLSMAGNVPVINTNVTSSVPSTGTMCGGVSITPGNPFDPLAQSAVVQLLSDLVTNNTPPLRLDGLDFGGVVNLQNPRLIAIENDGDADFGDYLAVTADPQ